MIQKRKKPFQRLHHRKKIGTLIRENDKIRKKKMPQQIPLLDLAPQYEPIKDQILKVMEEILDSKQFINGPKVDQFEKELAIYCESNYSIGMTSGSDTLIVALMAIDIKPGDEVITTPFTFFATVGAITRMGAIPIFVDINPETFNIDVTKIEEKITKKTKAIMPVHLFGQMAEMDPIMAIAKKHNLTVIEDSAQSIGATYKGKKACSIGDMGSLSFFPSKNLGCCGDGGALITQDEALAKKIKSLRNHGEVTRYHHQYIGGNFRLDALQAAILSIKLPLLEQQHEKRIKNAEVYNQNLKENKIKKPIIHKDCKSIYNQYTLRVENRDKFQTYLTENGIGSAIYYPRPMHIQECFEYLGHKEGDFKESERAAKEVISIPIYDGLTEKQLDKICNVINAFK